MRTIYKYIVLISDAPTLHQIPGDDIELLSVQMQGDNIVVWALVDTSKGATDVAFHVFGTGHPLLSDLDRSHYVGTVQQHGGALVWHVFAYRETGDGAILEVRSDNVLSP